MLIKIQQINGKQNNIQFKKELQGLKAAQKWRIFEEKAGCKLFSLSHNIVKKFISQFGERNASASEVYIFLLHIYSLYFIVLLITNNSATNNQKLHRKVPNKLGKGKRIERNQVYPKVHIGMHNKYIQENILKTSIF